MRDKMMLYGVTLAKRYTKRQKAYFLAHILESYSAYGFPAKLQSRKSWTGNINNVIAGSLETAGTIVAAAYDTPARAFLPGYRYYPFHTEKNKKEERKNILVQILIAAIFSITACAGTMRFFKTHAIGMLLLVFLSVGAAVWGIRVKKNPVNFNRNSASLAVMDKVAENLQGNENVAFVFLDQGVSSFEGFKLFRESLEDAAKDRKKRVILLDCIAYGDTLVAAHGQDDAESARKLIEIGENHELAIRDKVYTEEKIEGNILSFLPGGIYLASGSIENGEFVVKDTRSPKDTKVDMERLEKIAASIAAF